MPDHVMNYVECDAPAQLTLVEWRQTRFSAARRRRLRLRLPALRLAF
jgi:hypothetical protein